MLVVLSTTCCSLLAGLQVEAQIEEVTYDIAVTNATLPHLDKEQQAQKVCKVPVFKGTPNMDQLW